MLLEGIKIYLKNVGSSSVKAENNEKFMADDENPETLFHQLSLKFMKISKKKINENTIKIVAKNGFNLHKILISIHRQGVEEYDCRFFGDNAFLC
ncbi:CLUMA_CG013977, isoform A [Clunio marinus]|uniref:CLUMA_CG013977, isoform A n=1 Tax=Clunio marinus TaxID=568069 RepID=A0A1J1IKL9_9DIPT|nr:CLUMA_CG013977, isoform A [Clunio marinus]